MNRSIGLFVWSKSLPHGGNIDIRIIILDPEPGEAGCGENLAGDDLDVRVTVDLDLMVCFSPFV